MSTADSDSSSVSKLVVKTNGLIDKLAQLNSNVQLYTQVQSLQQNLNILEDNYKSIQKNKETTICNANCKLLNETKDPNTIDDFLIQLLLSKSNNSAASVYTLPSASAPPL